MTEVEKSEDYWKHKYELLEHAIGWLPPVLKEELWHRAAGHAGGKAYPPLFREPDTCEKIALTSINSRRVKELDNDELLNLHNRLHELWGRELKGVNTEDIVNAHFFVLNELKRRKVDFECAGELSEQLRKDQPDMSDIHILEWQKSVNDFAIVPDYICLVGSAIHNPAKAEDLDILIRDDTKDASLEVAIRKQLSPDKKKDLHFIYHSAGPHADYMPLWDLKAIATKGDIISIKAETEKALEEDETRAERTGEFWKDNWYKLYPLSGKGKFVYHHHWRGLSEDETELSEEQLLETDHSVHGDLRLEGRNGLFGFTVFTGTAKDERQAGGNRLANLPENDKLQGTFKLEQPIEWLGVGVKKPYISEPGGAGATSETYAKFFAIDMGTYDLGVMREHFLELFLHGKELKGRYLIQFAPFGRRRVWLISKPKEQEPYAESYDLEDVKQELRKKGQDYLVWAKPGEKPDLIKLVGNIAKSYEVPIWKTDDDKKLVYGIVLEPDTIDSQGDKVSAKEIEVAAHKFLKDSRILYKEHSQKEPECYVVESYITPESIRVDGNNVKRGSWVMVTYIGNDDLWKQIKTGQLTGYSIRGYAHRE